MSGCLNEARLIGNLGRDPEVRELPSGGKVVVFSVATSETWKSPDGSKNERTNWHNVVVFNEGLGGVAEKYLRKGSRVYLEGSIQSRSFEKDGQEKSVSEIVLGKYSGNLLLLDGKPAE